MSKNAVSYLNFDVKMINVLKESIIDLIAKRVEKEYKNSMRQPLG